MPTERQKRLRRETASQETQDSLKRLDGRGRDLHNIRTGEDLYENSVGESALRSGTDDSQRAVEATHQKDNSTDGRVLANSATDGTSAAEEAARAITARHQKTDSTDARVLRSHPTNNNFRSVYTDHMGDEAVTFAKLAKPSVGAIEIFDGNVTNPKLGTDSVDRRALKGLEVLDGHLETDAVGPRPLRSHSTDNTLRSVYTNHVGNEAITAAKLAKPSVGAIELFDLNVTNPKLGGNSVTKSKIASQSVGILEAHDELRGGSGADWRLRRQSGTGANTTTNFADHFHSIPFTRLEKTERLRINALDLTLAEHLKTERPGPLADLLQVTRDILHMLCDDPDLDRFERERRLDANPEWAKKYRADHFMYGDGPMHDHGPDLADRPSKAALWSTDEDRFKSAKVANVMAFKRALAASDGKAED